MAFDVTGIEKFNTKFDLPRSNNKAKVTPTATLSPADAIALIQSELQRKNIDEVPKGWMTAVDWAAKTNLSRVHIARVLKHGEANGLVESKLFRVKTGDVIRKIRHFKMKETK